MKKGTLGTLMLGIFLIAFGLLGLISGFASLSIVVDILAVAAGVLLIVASGKKIGKNVGLLLAAIYLIALGLISLLSFRFNGLDLIMAILAAAAGLVLLFTTKRITKFLGVLLFAIFLIAVGLLHFLTLGVNLDIVVQILAIAAGVLLLIGK
jgi:hypothetical protein